jgi:hypothetical protein
MARFRKKPVEIEAQQFFAGGPLIPGVRYDETQRPYVLHGDPSTSAQLFYLSDRDWVVTDPLEPGSYYRLTPFELADEYDRID